VTNPLAILLAIIAAVPGVLAYLHRNKALTPRIAQIASDTTVAQFNLLYDEARKQVGDCRKDCANLRDENSAIRADLVTARQREDVLEEKVDELEDKVRDLQRENTYLSELLRGRKAP
jgi:septal ring factor EnvC (AmiA/AmiB activator)